jgi:hypothetical protein
MFNAKTFNNFISKDDCDYLILKATESNLWEVGGHEFWSNRAINYESLLEYDKTAANIMLDANVRCNKKIKETYEVEEIYPDLLQVIRWFPGMKQGPHADDMSNTDVEGHRHRAFGSIIYLNDNYKGGHTYYPNFDLEIIPEAGKLALHPGDPEHLHGVTEIQEEIRYTLVSFWTKDKRFEAGWSKYKPIGTI